MTNCKHEFWPALQVYPEECKHCGLLKSTIEGMERADGIIGHDVSGTVSVRRPKQSTCKKCLQLQEAKICQICAECHPKQSTEMEDLLREFEEKMIWKANLRRQKDFLAAAYHSGHTAGQAAASQEIYHEASTQGMYPSWKVEELVAAAKQAGQAAERGNLEQNIGFLRQWLNEKPAGLVTDEQIRGFLTH